MKSFYLSILLMDIAIISKLINLKGDWCGDVSKCGTKNKKKS